MPCNCRRVANSAAGSGFDEDAEYGGSIQSPLVSGQVPTEECEMTAVVEPYVTNHRAQWDGDLPCELALETT